LTIKIFERQTKNKTRQPKETRNMFEKLRELIVDQLNVEESAVTMEAKFKDDLGADSLDLFELVMAIEEEFGVEIPSSDLESIVSVEDVVAYLENKGVEE
jgi:acyl carrier protein